MTDVVSVPLDLIPTPLFRKKYNLSYGDGDFDGTEKFELVISANCPDNISNCLNSSTGVLASGVTVSSTANVALELVEQGDVACYVKIKSDVVMSLASDVDVKGIFLRKKSGGFVLMAMVNDKPIRFCNGMTFEADNVLFVVEG